MATHNRPQREDFSLKTMDIPGAMGKKVIPDRKLVYQEKQMPQYGGHSQRSQYNEELSHIDPYELQKNIRHSG